jgi:hypothetical protein
MVMDLVGPGTAIRKVERAATEADTEASLRVRIGQRTSQRQRQHDDVQGWMLAHGTPTRARRGNCREPHWYHSPVARRAAT